jgi:hypothetical protein
MEHSQQNDAMIQNRAERSLLSTPPKRRAA